MPSSFVDAGNDRVGISTASPSALLDVDGGDALIHGVTVVDWLALREHGYSSTRCELHVKYHGTNF